MLLRQQKSDLEGELCAAEVGLLLLPEVVRFDDERHADLGREELLQRLQQRLDELPLGAAHVDDDGEAALADVLAVERGNRMGQKKNLLRRGTIR